ncbi:Transcription factor, partial [Coemansia sp. BCRC 34490]
NPVACVFCQRSHMSCDDQRPCHRCIKRNISHLCRDKDPVNDSANGQTPTKASADGASGARKVKKDRSIIPIVPAIKAAADIVNSAVDGQVGVASSHAAAVTTVSEAAVSLANIQAMTVVDSNVLPIIASAHSTVLPMGSVSTSTSQGFVPDTTIPVHGLSARPQGNNAAADIESGTNANLYSGVRFENNSLLAFGNDAASNEFSALNEFLESLQRGIRNAEKIESDTHLSNPPSGSPSEPPSIRGVGSPLVDPFNQGNPAGGNSGGGGMQSGQAFQPQYANIPSNANGNLNSTSNINSRIQATVPISSGAGQNQQDHMQQERTHSLPTISQLMTNSNGEGVTQTERFLLTAADPSDGTSEDKLRQIINAKYEAGILKPYNYVSGYTRMQRFMETNISKQNIIRILDVLNTFRPTFRSIAQSLTDIDLLLVEEGFERLLLDYDNVFNSFG